MNDWTSWERLGHHRHLAGHDVFTIDMPARGQERREPLLVLHGFPTSSFDFHLVVDSLAENRRVLLMDMVGYGLSSKPDQAYSMDFQADVVMAYTSELGIDRLALLTHDMGDTVGGELLARQLEGRWPVQVTGRLVTNGSIYIRMAQLSVGQ
ncbi:MAG TPA: alpha/beta fold hydrolase [Acidimicrobiales bacterium]|nr:alpha/beta fold hydrolase [Acidimicrobiales bacterium]